MTEQEGYGEYTCTDCGGTFIRVRPYAEALEEKETLWGDTPLENCVEVCADCFKKIMGMPPGGADTQ